MEGFDLLSAYSKARRAEVMKEFEKLHYGVDISFYIGADMEYSVHKEPNRVKRCIYNKPSLNCIIKWNQGLWADALGDGKGGVGFYKGHYDVDGSDLINGYNVPVLALWQRNLRPGISNHEPTLDGFYFLVYTNDWTREFVTKGNYFCFCEIQDGTITRASAPTTTTEAPTTTRKTPTNTTNKSQSAGSEVSGAPDKSVGKSGWSSGLIAVVVVLSILLVALAVVLCLCCCGCIRRPKANGRRVTEDLTATIHTDRDRIVMRERTENPNMGTASDNEMNPLVREDRSEIQRNTLIETPQQANAMVRADGAVTSDSDAAAEQQTRRRRSIRRARSRRRVLNVPEVEVPIAGEIVEDTVGEWH